jgi:hypothetical protein
MAGWPLLFLKSSFPASGGGLWIASSEHEPNDCQNDDDHADDIKDITHGDTPLINDPVAVDLISNSHWYLSVPTGAESRLKSRGPLIADHAQTLSLPGSGTALDRR